MNGIVLFFQAMHRRVSLNDFVQLLKKNCFVSYLLLVYLLLKKKA